MPHASDEAGPRHLCRKRDGGVASVDQEDARGATAGDHPRQGTEFDSRIEYGAQVRAQRHRGRLEVIDEVTRNRAGIPCRSAASKGESASAASPAAFTRPAASSRSHSA